MKRYNIVIVINLKEDRLLMCYRSRDPYKGLYNLVGGKIEDEETDIEAAYRELKEETGITNKDINLTFLMDFFYKMKDMELQVYVGKLNKDIEVIEEVNSLEWIDINSNFFDVTKFAGEGNIGHMLEQVKIHKEQLFN